MNKEMNVTLNFTATPEQIADLRREVCDQLQGITVMYDMWDSPLGIAAGGDWTYAMTCSDKELIEIAFELGIISIN